MPIDFRLVDFLHPERLLRLRRSLERTQWLPPDELQAHQDALLCRVVRRAAARVPYYRTLFAEHGLDPLAFRGREDLARLPRLPKSVLRERPESLLADDAPRHRPRWHQTSGTTGTPVRFVLDREANALEFCFYWRHWSWAGYRLGDRFAELGTVHFLRRGRSEALEHWQPHLSRLMLNAARVAPGNAARVAAALAERRVRYLKGMPSALAHLVRVLDEARARSPLLRAVFSTGEVLTPADRAAIEAAFGCQVLDACGHMERTVAIAQCPAGGYHVQADYGLLETVDRTRAADGRPLASILGTSLHTRAMPLLRYEVGDDVELLEDGDGRTCACGRTLPLVKRVLGRSQDTIETPDGRRLSSLFVLFDLVGGVRCGQVLQEAPDRLTLLVVPGAGWSSARVERLEELGHAMAGAGMTVRVVEGREANLLRDSSGKLRPVVGLAAKEAS